MCYSLGPFRDPKTIHKLITVACKQDTKEENSFSLMYSGNKELQLVRSSLKNNTGAVFPSPCFTNVALLGQNNVTHF